VALVLPALLAIGMALPDHLLDLVCRSGAVMDIETCCPFADDSRARSAGNDALRDEACCSLRAVDLDRALLEGPGQVRGGARDAVAVLALLPEGASVVSRPEGRPLRRPVAPPPLGPPLILLKHAFLL